jgi:hypothetical protein
MPPVGSMGADALQVGPVPARQLGCGGVGRFHEAQQGGFGVGGRGDDFVGQDELAESVEPEGGVGFDSGG